MSLRDRKRALLLRRARERHEGALVERFFGGEICAFRWAEPLSDEQPLSPTWRLWITQWPAVRRLANQLESRSQIVVLFGSMPDVGGVVAAGGTVRLRLEAWIREDADLIRLRDPSGRWEASLDVYENEVPRVALVVAGEPWVDLDALGDGTEAWRWDFLPEALNTAAEAIKHLVLADQAVDENRLGGLLGGFGLRLLGMEHEGRGKTSTLTVGVGPEPDAQGSFDNLRRALVADVPDLVVKKERL